MLDLIPGTGSSNPPPSSGESTNFRFLSGGARIVEKLSPIVIEAVGGLATHVLMRLGIAEIDQHPVPHILGNNTGEPSDRVSDRAVIDADQFA